MSLSGDEVVSQDTSHTSLINDEEAATYARAASRMTSTLGTIREKNINLSYQVSKVSKNKILVVFLDTTSYYNSSQALLSLSILLSMFGFIFLSSLSVPYQELSFVPSFETTKSSDVLLPMLVMN